MAKCEREEEFEVSEVAPLQPLSRYPSPTVACTDSPLSVQCYTVKTKVCISYLKYAPCNT